MSIIQGDGFIRKSIAVNILKGMMKDIQHQMEYIDGLNEVISREPFINENLDGENHMSPKLMDEIRYDMGKGGIE